MRMKNKRICGRHLVHWGACGRNLALIGVAALLVTACADEDLANKDNNKTNGTAVGFHVTEVQSEALAKSAVGLTRGLGSEPILSADLAAQKLAVKGSGAQDMCIIESTVEGVNPVKMDAKTRGEVTTLSNLQMFSSSGYRGASPTGISQTPNWFYSEDTNPDGTLLKRYDWDWPVNTYARFYAIHPKVTAAHGMVLSNNSYAGAPQVTFTVNPDVTQHQDLMTACSGNVHYVHGNDPTTNLEFRHALTAIKFAIGENLSFAYITKVEIRNAIVKGKYTLADNLGGTRPVAGDNGWTMNDADRGNVSLTLAAPGVSTVGAKNSVIVGKPGQNYVFYMIPQKVKGKHVWAVITLSDGQTISAELKAEWKAGTTKELKLTQATSTLDYHFTLTDNDLSFAYDDGAGNPKPFEVESWREGSDPATGLSLKQAVAWKVIKYEEWDDATHAWMDKGTTKPAWLGTVGESGAGADGSAEAVNATVVSSSVSDHLANYNKVLKDATPKGSATNPFNLANPTNGATSSDITESANSYLISAPGHYRIPLVYGNAIKNGRTNIKSFHTANTDAYVLRDFLDHANRPIQHALIREQNGGMATQAAVVWQDQPNLIKNASLHINDYPVHIDGTTKNVDFVEFEVTKNDIRNGNAVIAVKDAGGTVLWSWHLWFDHADALDEIPCKNYGGVVYKFTRNALGAVHLTWKTTDYQKPRRARLTIEQQGGNNHTKKTSTVTITQNPGNVRKDAATLYQFGRKDAFPGTETIYPANGFSFDDNTPSGKTYGDAIMNPGTMFREKRAGINAFDWCAESYVNAWSINNTSLANWSDAPVDKTIYDPCPAGFHVPAAKAFTGFTTSGANSGYPLSNFNIAGAWNNGWTFYTEPNPTSTTPTIYFPASGTRASDDGTLKQVGEYGFYWSVSPLTLDVSYLLSISRWRVYPMDYLGRVRAYGIRPVAQQRTSVKPKAPGSTEEQWGSEQQVGGTEIDLDN